MNQTTQHDAELATRMQRFWAAMIDGLLYGVPSMFITNQLGLWTWPKTRGEQLPLSAILAITVFSFALFLLINFKPLKEHGQTVGKRLLKIKIVDKNNQTPDIKRVILLRYLPGFLLHPIPIVGKLFSLIDPLLVLRRSKTCLHDLIAGTKVVRALDIQSE